MPLGKPDPVTGEVVAAGRHYGGGHGYLGNVGVWVCPGCGAKNTTEFVQGCPTCGAGKPGEARKVEPPQRPPVKPGHARGASPQPAASSSVAPSAPSISTSSAAPQQRGVPESGVVRVVRLIEYLIAPGKLQAGELTLRRSLVGKHRFDWGQITATIVDEVSLRQEEILKLANLQPGVWLGGPTADQQHGQTIREIVDMALTRPLAPKPAAPAAPPPPAEPAAVPEPALPDVGIAVRVETQDLANQWAEQYGYRFCNTLALALSAIAEELKGNMEPRKFLASEDVLEFAQALMNTIPSEWEGDAEEEQIDGQA